MESDKAGRAEKSIRLDGEAMLEFNHFYGAYAPASADPHLQSIARGLSQLLEPSRFEELPKELGDLVARLAARDDGDGPDRG